jgi:hypothetical protein
MGGQSSGGTTRTEPPKYQLPFLQHGVGEARNLYDWQSQNPANVVAGQNGSTIDALRNTADMARAGNPITSTAGNLAQQTLSGGFLGSNPYLDQTFNRAALQTQNQLAGQFARSGRNVDASQDLRSGQLNDLATQIYGGAYDAERNRQQQVLGMSPALGQARYADMDRLLNVGQIQEGYQQQQLDARGSALDDYMNRISGNMGSTVKVSQPGGFSGSGAMGGAMLGNMLFPGVGGIIGGGLLGGFG